MPRKLILVPSMNVPEEIAHLEKVDVNRSYRDIVNRIYDDARKRLDSFDWKVDKVYELGPGQEENARELEKNLEKGWESAHIIKRLMDSGARYVVVGDKISYLECGLWERRLQTGYVDEGLLSGAYADLAKSAADDLSRDLKDGETGMLQEGAAVADKMSFPETIQIDLVDPLGIYKNQDRRNMLYLLSQSSSIEEFNETLESMGIYKAKSNGI